VPCLDTCAVYLPRQAQLTARQAASHPSQQLPDQAQPPPPLLESSPVAPPQDAAQVSPSTVSGKSAVQGEAAAPSDLPAAASESAEQLTPHHTPASPSSCYPTETSVSTTCASLLATAEEEVQGVAHVVATEVQQDDAGLSSGVDQRERERVDQTDKQCLEGGETSQGDAAAANKTDG